jgi:hypothetical protein
VKGSGYQRFAGPFPTHIIPIRAHPPPTHSNSWALAVELWCGANTHEADMSSTETLVEGDGGTGC